MQDITLSNGVRIPAGTLMAASANHVHQNESKYTNPSIFDPFRFSSMRKEGDASRFQFVNTSVDYIPFGVGTHAWYAIKFFTLMTQTLMANSDSPGRFFASSELKSILAYIVLNYDIKLAAGGGRPENVWLGPSISPPDVDVLFRRRNLSKA